MEPFQELEKTFGEWVGWYPENTVVCSSGTAALHLALEGLRLPAGAEVIVPDLTMIACARAVTMAGLVPVFVDCRDDLLIDPDRIDEVCSRAGPGRQRGGNIVAIMPVHIYGRQCDMGAITDLADKYDLFVIEDLAEAHGVEPHEKSDTACWSFYRNKIVAGEEGGAVIFRYPEAAALARQLRCLGFTDAHDFTHVPRGHNYRLANCLAEKVLSNFVERNPNEYVVDWNWARRWQIIQWCDDACPLEWKMPKRDAPWVYDMRIRGLLKGGLDELVSELHREGIVARHGFKPCSDQAEYRSGWGAWKIGGEGDSCARRASREVFYLPISPGITTEKNVKRAFQTIHRALGR